MRPSTTAGMNVCCKDPLARGTTMVKNGSTTQGPLPVYPQQRTTTKDPAPLTLCAINGPEQAQQHSPHSMTSSARARSVGGIVRPSALAVLELITNWNLVGCSIGNSPGLAPFKIMST